jgi:hypothetical protein
MRASIGTVRGTAACLLFSSACGGTLLLGDSENGGNASAGRGAHSGNGGGIGLGPVEVGGGSAGSTAGASAGASFDSSMETADADDSGVDASEPSDGALPPGYTRPTSCGASGSAYTLYDPHNCGTCGHDCLGGACDAGVCVPLPAGVLASGLIAPVSVAVDATYVYWLSEGTYTPALAPSANLGTVQLMKCAKTGCNNTPTVLATGFADAPFSRDRLEGIVSDGKNVYWAAIGYIFACSVNGCGSQPTLIASPTVAMPSSNIGVNATNVYSGSATDVFSCPTTGCTSQDGGGPNNLWAGNATGVAIDSTNLYWLSYGAVLSCALGGCNGTPSLLASPAPSGVAAGQIVLDQGNVYWNLGVPNSFAPPSLVEAPGYTFASSPSPYAEILKCGKGGCNGQPSSIVPGLGAPMALATDGINVYFTDLGSHQPPSSATNTGLVAKCPVAGCPDGGTMIAGSLENPRGIAVDATNIYWADFGSGAVDIDSVCPAGSTPCPSSEPLSVDGRIMVSPK